MPIRRFPHRIKRLGIDEDLPEGISSVTKLLDPPEPDTNYAVFCAFNWRTTYAITKKARAYFTVTFATTGAGAKISWILVRE